MQKVNEIEEREHVRGPADAALTLVEYGDFQCPYCARAHLALVELGEQFAPRGGIRLVFRHLPLSELHPLAEAAAEAAEAAASQDRFWDMHDALYENQDQMMDEQDLATLAQDLELDTERFRGDMQARRQRARVQADLERARQDGASRTPSIFINGVLHRGDSDRASLERALVEALERR